MKMHVVRRFIGREVVGQMRNGLFFEGRVVDRADRAIVVTGEECEESIEPRGILWLAPAIRYA